LGDVGGARADLERAAAAAPGGIGGGPDGDALSCGARTRKASAQTHPVTGRGARLLRVGIGPRGHSRAPAPVRRGAFALAGRGRARQRSGLAFAMAARQRSTPSAPGRPAGISSCSCTRACSCWG
jgi:hypothetical protein